MKQVDFLRRFLSNDKYRDEKSSLPYPSISLTNNEGELWIRGTTSSCTVILTSNAKDAVITVNGKDYPFDDGKLTLILDEGTYPYVITKGSLKDEYVLKVYPSALLYNYAGETKVIDYTAQTITYSDDMSGSLVVESDMVKALNFTGITQSVSPTWEDTANWLTNDATEKNKYTATLNPSVTHREADITAKLGTLSRTIHVEQDGNPKVVTSYTYNVTSISTPTVAADVTTATITYIGITIANHADGSNTTITEPLSQGVTFAPNDLPSPTATTGTFNWLPTNFIETQPQIPVNWVVNQLASGPVVTSVTYSVSNVIAPSEVDWNVTSAIVSFIGTTYYHYNDDTTTSSSEACSETVTFGTNDTGAVVDRSGSFKWHTEDVDWAIQQRPNITPVSTAYTVSNIVTSPSLVDYSATTATVSFIGTTTIKYNDDTTTSSSEACSETVTFGTNDTGAVVDRSGSFKWHTEDVDWATQQNYNRIPVSTTYSVSNISTSPSLVDYSATTATVSFIGTTTIKYNDNTQDSTSEPCNETVTFGTNDTGAVVDRSGSFKWHTEDVDWATQQNYNRIVTSITHSVSVTNRPSVDYSATTANITYVGTTTYHYNDGGSADSTENLNQNVSFNQNATNDSVERTGTFYWAPEKYMGGETQPQIPVNWIVDQDYYHYRITAITHSVKDISSPTVEYSATTANISYVGTTTKYYADSSINPLSSSEILNEDVTFETNTTTLPIPRTGTFNWLPTEYLGDTQPEIPVDWTVTQNPDGMKITAITHYVTSITANNVDWDTTAQTITYQGVTVYYYNNGTDNSSTEALSEVVTFAKNDSDTSVTRTGTFNWLPTEYLGDTQPEIPVDWSLEQGYNPDKKVKDVDYLVSGVTATPNPAEWSATTATINYKGVTVTTYESDRKAYSEEALSKGVTFAKNFETSAVTRTGTFNWEATSTKSVPVDWSLEQKGHDNDITATTYSVEYVNVVPNPAECTDTAATVNYNEIPTYYYRNGDIKPGTSVPKTKDVEFAQNASLSSVTRSGTFTHTFPDTTTGTVNWTLEQKENVAMHQVYVVKYVNAVPNPAECTDTAATVNYTATPVTSYKVGGDVSGTPLNKTQSVEFAQNSALSGVTRSGQFDAKIGISSISGNPIKWSLYQQPNEVTQRLGLLKYVSTIPSEVEWDVTSSTVTYTYTPITAYKVGGNVTGATQTARKQVTFDQNLETSAVTRSGTFEVKKTGVTIVNNPISWSVKQGGKKAITSYTYTVSDVSSPTVGAKSTGTSISYIGHTIAHYSDGTSEESEKNLNDYVTYPQNTQTVSVDRTGTFNWYPEGGDDRVYVLINNDKFYRDSSKDETPRQVSMTFDLDSGKSGSYGWVTYEGDAQYQCYRSTNVSDANSYVSMKIMFSGIPDFKLYINSYAESRYDYTIAWDLDFNVTTGQNITQVDASATGVKTTTSGKQTSPSSIDAFTEVSYANDGGEHFVWITYRKDTSGDEYDDRGYVWIPYYGSSTVTPRYAYTSNRLETIYGTGSEYPSTFNTSTVTNVYWVKNDSGEYISSSTTGNAKFILELIDNCYITINDKKYFRNGINDYANTGSSGPYYYFAYTSDDGDTVYTNNVLFTSPSTSLLYVKNGDTFTRASYTTAQIKGPYDLVSVPVDWTVHQNPLGIDVKLYNSSDTLLYTASTDTLNAVSVPSTYKSNTSKIEISSSVESIDTGVCDGWTMLKSIEIMGGNTNNIASIGENAFNNCSNLTKVPLTDKVTSIGRSAFENCSKLTTLTEDGSNTLSSNKKFTTIKEKTFKGCSSLPKITIPGNITTIENSAFANTTKLGTLNLNDGLTTIGASAFSHSMSDVSASGTLRVDLPNTVTSVGDYGFYNCRQMSGMTLSTNMSQVNTYCFAYCARLKVAEILSNIITIQDYAFCYSTDAKVEFESGVTTIGKWAFAETYSQLSLFEYGFYNGQSVMEIPDTVTSIGEYVFFNCAYLPSSIISKNIATISEGAFQDCVSMTNADLQSNVNSTLRVIDEYAFMNCISLDNVVFPKGLNNEYPLQEIHKQAFFSCSTLSSIDITENVYIIGDGSRCDEYTRVFSYCPSLATITVASANTTYTDEGSACCYKSANSACGKYSVCFGGQNSVINNTEENLHIGQFAFEGNIQVNPQQKHIPDNVTRIEKFAFYDCSSLTKITANRYTGQLRYIGDHAFAECSSLTLFENYPDTLTEIDNYAFYNCVELDSSAWSSNVQRFGVSSYENCHKLGDIWIPDNTIEIDEKAFFHCCNQGNIIIIGPKVSSIGSRAFSYNSGCTSLIVDENNTTYYSYENTCIKTSDKMAVFGCCKSKFDSSELSPKSIGDYAFEGNIMQGRDGEGSYTTLSFLSSFTGSIGKYAFYDCIALGNPSSPAGWSLGLNTTSIGTYAFYNCKNLHPSILIGAKVASIGAYAFSGCISIKTITYNATSNNTKVHRTYAPKVEKVYIGNGYTEISSSAFNDCGDTLTCVRPVSDTTTTGILLPDSVTTIGNYAFAKSSNITGVINIKNVQTVGSEAFSGCGGTSLVFYALTSIDSYGFESMKNLTIIRAYNDTPPTMISSSFYGVSDTGTIYVKNTTAQTAYTNDDNWHSGYSSKLKNWTITVI